MVVEANRHQHALRVEAVRQAARKQKMLDELAAEEARIAAAEQAKEREERAARSRRKSSEGEARRSTGRARSRSRSRHRSSPTLAASPQLNITSSAEGLDQVQSVLELQEKNEKLQTDLLAARAKIAELERQLEDQTTVLNDNITEATAFKQQKEALDTKLQSVQTEFTQKYQQQSAKHYEEFKKKEQEIKNLEGQVISYAQQCKNYEKLLQERNTAIQQTAGHAERRKGESENEVGTLNRKLAELQKLADQHKDNVDREKQTNQDTQKQLRQAVEASHALQRQLQQKNEECAALEEKKAELEQRLVEREEPGQDQQEQGSPATPVQQNEEENEEEEQEGSIQDFVFGNDEAEVQANPDDPNLDLEEDPADQGQPPIPDQHQPADAGQPANPPIPNQPGLPNQPADGGQPANQPPLPIHGGRMPINDAKQLHVDLDVDMVTGAIISMCNVGGEPVQIFHACRGMPGHPCQTQFQCRTVRELEKHKAEVHQLEPNLVCDRPGCTRNGREFKATWSLRRHRRICDPAGNVPKPQPVRPVGVAIRQQQARACKR